MAPMNILRNDERDGIVASELLEVVWLKLVA
jgi:hypothetical protein